MVWEETKTFFGGIRFMTNGTSQGLFIVVGVVIFGIFISIAYVLFGDDIKVGLGSVFDDSIDEVKKKEENSEVLDKGIEEEKYVMEVSGIMSADSKDIAQLDKPVGDIMRSAPRGGMYYPTTSGWGSGLSRQKVVFG